MQDPQNTPTRVYRPCETEQGTGAGAKAGDQA
jgi:hypothetical protein